jgi:hypothetical protein
MNDSFSFGLPFSVSVVWVFAAWILTGIVHISFALAVFADTQLLWKHLRRRTFLLGGGLWALATLLGGVYVAGIYWLIHHSTLHPQQSPVEAPEDRNPAQDSGCRLIRARHLHPLGFDSAA